MKMPAVALAFLIVSAQAADARELTFEDRVRAQAAIERVRYVHQVGATEPFETAVPREVLEEKVRTYLEQSAALKQLWHTPVTGEMLEREMERIVKSSRMSGRLEELYAALGNDPFLVAECLVRPVLVDRLTRRFFEQDETIHEPARKEAEGLRAKLLLHGVKETAGDPRRSDVELVRSAAEGTFAPPEREEAGSRTLRLSPDAFRGLRARAPRTVGEIGPITDEGTAFRITVVLDEGPDHVHIVNFLVAKRSWRHFWSEVRPRLDLDGVPTVAETILRISRADRVNGDSGVADTWDNRSLDDAPDGRWEHVAVWTGTEMIVWGGFANSGGAYDPATDSWRLISTKDAPITRRGISAVWTGKEMIVWGGREVLGVYNTNLGGRYDPVTDHWTATSTVGAPSARGGHTAVWTGTEMIVWGGTADSTGGRYDPETDSWAPTSTWNAPTFRIRHVAVWTGDRMIVWGGFGGDGSGSDYEYLDTGGQYDPRTDSWAFTTIALIGPRADATAVWTGSRMLVWGGTDGGNESSIGGQYDPATDSWTWMSDTNAPAGRTDHTAVWSGTEMLVWGGNFGGGRYNPATDSWTPISLTGSIGGFGPHTAVWTGSLMVFWGGLFENGGLGRRYDPANDEWTPVATGTGPFGEGRTAVWTGNEILLWGGILLYVPVQGSRYDPVLDAWTPMELDGQPTERTDHTAIWTGREMIVWGGNAASSSDFDLNTGGRYSPLRDQWKHVQRHDAPIGRHLHLAVWTGSRMVVWGGVVRHHRYRTGGLYDPVTNTWTSMTVEGAPEGNYRSASVWTGSRMIVWGGQRFDRHGSETVNTGGMYDPSGNQWTPISVVGAPEGRFGHTATWTGTRMLVWGGKESLYLSSGGSYDPGTDSWTALSLAEAPPARTSHTAIWTGTEMIVWGGRDGSFDLDSGGRYDPSMDSWSATSSQGVPCPRYDHTAIWTGEEMIVWGGEGGPSTGGRYLP